MPDFTLTPEQTAVIEHVARAETNLIVEARAGAAKTTTLVEAAKVAPSPVLCLAFNKAIAEEMSLRLPDGTDAKTLHSLGYSAWRDYVGRPCKVEKDKCRTIFKSIVGGLDKKTQDDMWEQYSTIMKAVGAAKNNGALPASIDSRRFKAVCNLHDWRAGYVVNLTDDEFVTIEEILERSFTLALEGIVDFDDMVMCPAVAGVSFPFYRTIMVDESQDLSPLNHMILAKLVRSPRTRLIAVGDPFQAIYGFRGADQKSMTTLRKTFNMDRLTLTTSFRCAQQIVREAHWLVEDMRWPEWAAAGSVLRPNGWGVEDIPEDDVAIICRNNAPLYGMAMRLIAEGRSCELSGRDITEHIEKELRSLQPKRQPPLDREAALIAIDAWEEGKKRRIKDQKLVEDQAECLRIFVRATDNLADACEMARALASQRGRVKLMTGHRSKGLEFRTVFFLDEFLLYGVNDPESQDANLKYVIQTRAKEHLIYVSTETFGRREEEEA